MGIGLAVGLANVAVVAMSVRLKNIVYNHPLVGWFAFIFLIYTYISQFDKSYDRRYFCKRRSMGNKFIARKSDHPYRRKLYKLDEHGNRIDGAILVDIVRDDVAEGVTEHGTPITAEKLNEGNWQCDESVVFTKRADNTDPESIIDKTQIYTKANGETWLMPPGNKQTAVPIGRVTGTVVKVLDNEGDPREQVEILFKEDPQKQLDKQRDELNKHQDQLDEHEKRLNEKQEELSSKHERLETKVTETEIRTGLIQKNQIYYAFSNGTRIFHVTTHTTNISEITGARVGDLIMSDAFVSVLGIQSFHIALIRIVSETSGTLIYGAASPLHEGMSTRYTGQLEFEGLPFRLFGFLSGMPQVGTEIFGVVGANTNLGIPSGGIAHINTQTNPATVTLLTSETVTKASISRLLSERVSTVDPVANGNPSAGNSLNFSREDHRHPASTTLASTVDLNTVTQNGIFEVIGANANSPVGANISNLWSTLVVYGGTGNSRLTQIFYVNDGREFRRNFRGGTWSAWHELGMLSTTVPLSDRRTGAVGTSLFAARADHRHPVTLTALTTNSTGVASGTVTITNLQTHLANFAYIGIMASVTTGITGNPGSFTLIPTSQIVGSATNALRANWSIRVYDGTGNSYAGSVRFPATGNVLTFVSTGRMQIHQIFGVGG